MSRNTASQYRHRPPLLRLANLAGRRLGLAARVSLDAETLIDASVTHNGADDFGPAGWRDGFERLCVSLENQSRLNYIGRLSAQRHLQQLLSNRLAIERARLRDPDIATQTIARPIFITGLPRSGSTLLHGLVAQDPLIRVPWTWEVMLVGDPPGHDPVADRRAIARAEAMLSWVHRLAPQFRSIHPIGARLAQECIAITAHEFASVEFHTTFNVPDYQRWLDDQDQIGALRYHRRIVQHLQRHSGPRQWIFKAPAHLRNIPAILAVYPDAQFVVTHRNPENVVASIASHGVVLRNAFSDEVDNEAVADDWMRWWAGGWQLARSYIAQHPQRFTELDYDALVADPLDAVSSLYAQLGLTLSSAARSAMQSFLAANAQHKYGRHRYTLQQFGLDAKDIHRLYST